MIALDEVKKYLNIDFADHDDQLAVLLGAAASRASVLTGLDLENEVCDIQPTLKILILQDIERGYQGKEFNQAALYRQFSIKPI